MYEYDAVSRIRQVNYGDTSVSFTYDPAGYRTSIVTPDVSASYSYSYDELVLVQYCADTTFTGG